MTGKNKTIKCEECEKETTNFYPVFTNKGRAYKCAECYENGVRRGTRIYQLTSNKNNYEKQIYFAILCIYISEFYTTL